MGVIGLLAVFFGKKSSVILSLVLAAGLMLLVNPLWLWDISFQLSFLATMGIIILGPSGKNQGITIKAKIINELKIHLHTSIAAQVFTVPLIFFYFNRVSLVAPLSNVLIGPVIPIIMTLGLLLCLVGFVWLPLGYPFAWVLSPLISYLVAVVRISSEIPFASLELI